MRRLFLSVAVMLAVVSFAVTARGASQCGPFGDSPAAVSHGWFASFVANHNPVCFGGRVLGPWRDSSGSDRFACLYEPASASSESPLPLLIFLHGSLTTADSILATNLRALVSSADLGGAGPGFILIVPEGRYTRHYYPGIDAVALGWDNWYRNLDPSGDLTSGGTGYPENADAAAIDHFVAEEIATGKVDRNRIYLSGWSNGAAMALLYALNRPWVSAAAVYSSPDPFRAFDDPCGQKPVRGAPSDETQLHVANPRAPLMHVRNSCDVAGLCPSGDAFAAEMKSLGASLDDVLLDSSEQQVAACDSSCGSDPYSGDAGFSGGVRGFWHHMRWPKSWTQRMLEFLKEHPLPVARKS